MAWPAERKVLRLARYRGSFILGNYGLNNAASQVKTNVPPQFLVPSYYSRLPPQTEDEEEEDEEQEEPPPLLSDGVSLAPAPTPLPIVGSLLPSPAPTETLHLTTLTCENTSFEAMLAEYVALRIYSAHGVPSADPTLDVSDKRGEHTLDIELKEECIPAEMDDLNAMSKQIARIVSL